MTEHFDDERHQNDITVTSVCGSSLKRPDVEGDEWPLRCTTAALNSVKEEVKATSRLEILTHNISLNAHEPRGRNGRQVESQL